MTTKKCLGIGIAHYSRIDILKTNTDESCQTKLSSVPSGNFTSLDSFDCFRFHSCQQPEKNTKRSPNKVPVLLLFAPQNSWILCFFSFIKRPLSKKNPAVSQGTTSSTTNYRGTSACAAPYLASTEATRGQPWAGRGLDQRSGGGGFTVSSTSSGWWFFTNPLEKICAS